MNYFSIGTNDTGGKGHLPLQVPGSPTRVFNGLGITSDDGSTHLMSVSPVWATGGGGGGTPPPTIGQLFPD